MLKIWGTLLAGLVVATIFAGAASQAEGATTIKVCGSGYGHGVGLSQYGAYGRAKAGQGYARIIKSYYRGVGLQKLTNDPLVRVLLGQKSLSGSHRVVVRSGSKARLINLKTRAFLIISGPAISCSHNSRSSRGRLLR